MSGYLKGPLNTSELSRYDLLTIQFTKIINYFRADAASEWGGAAGRGEGHENDQAAAEHGYQRFLADVDGYGDEALPRWLHKKLDAVCWGPDNFYLSPDPEPALGRPHEPYLGLNGCLLTIQQASRILSMKPEDLARLKLASLLDSEVIDVAIKRMLLPRHEWPRLRLTPLGAGRTLQVG